MPTILIVDDEIQNINALKRSLGDENPSWNILTAQNESSAEAILREQFGNGNHVDVVLTDLVMDCDASGMNILQKARQIDPFIMTILITAKEKCLDRYKAFDFGAFDVVEKNIRGAQASTEINIKTRAALQYREWSQRISFLRRYFDPKVFDAITQNPSVLEPARKTVTIAFWDIRGFSRLCESLKAHPQLISGFLRDYCELGAQIIFEHNGVLDKFIGDGIMALFGVLNPDESDAKDDAFLAVKTALKLKNQFPSVVDSWKSKWELYIPDKIDIGLGCGIHTGEVLVGNVGTIFRDQFTALGPQVNFASRIEARSASGQILISQSTQARIKSKVATVSSGEISDIKNIPGSFQIFEVKNII